MFNNHLADPGEKNFFILYGYHGRGREAELLHLRGIFCQFTFVFLQGFFHLLVLADKTGLLHILIRSGGQLACQGEKHPGNLFKMLTRH